VRFSKRFVVSIILTIMSPLAIATSAQAAPSNDNIANATLFSGSAVTGTTSAASDEASEFNQSDPQFQKTVWYYWEPSSAGTVTFDVCGSTPVTKINAYETTASNALNSVPASATTSGSACSSGDDQTLTFSAATGKRYYIQILTKNGDAGAFTINYAASGGGGGGGGGGTPSAPTLTKVTLCHRTHSLTNPYVLVTVSVNSVVKTKGHGSHNSDSKHNAASQQGIFKGADAYPKANTKFWGDIIPPFNYAGGTYAGLNWKWGTISDADSNAWYTKTEFKALDKTSGTATAAENAALELCRGTAGEVSKTKAAGRLTSKDLFDDGRKFMTRDEILDEIKDTLDPNEDSDVDPKVNEDLKSELPASEGPKKQPSSVPDQSLSGNVWLDLNRNGFQEDNEPDMPNIKVTVSQSQQNVAGRLIERFSNTGGGKQMVAAVHWATKIPLFAAVTNHVKGLLRTVTTYTVLTDSNGWYVFKTIGAGDWTAVGVVPDGLYVTYDSYDLSDASVEATVPVSGHAHTWIGLVGETGVNAKVKNPDGTPATKTVTVRSAGTDGKFCTKDDVNYEFTPVNGAISADGLSAGKYSVTKIGTKNTIGDFTVGSSTYTSAITTKYGTKCTSAQLAATGNENQQRTAGLIAFALLSIVSGIVILTRKERANHA
jgi:hypothetical protein